jgi:hypothetical protein
MYELLNEQSDFERRINSWQEECFKTLFPLCWFSGAQIHASPLQTQLKRKYF